MVLLAPSGNSVPLPREEPEEPVEPLEPVEPVEPGKPVRPLSTRAPGLRLTPPRFKRRLGSLGLANQNSGC